MTKEELRREFGNTYSEKIRSQITTYNPDYVYWLENKVLSKKKISVNIENLKALVYGVTLNVYQRSLARQEFEEISKIIDTPTIRNYEIGFRYTNRTDAILHNEIIEAENPEDAIMILYDKYRYEVKWENVKEIN